MVTTSADSVVSWQILKTIQSVFTQRLLLKPVAEKNDREEYKKLDVFWSKWETLNTKIASKINLQAILVMTSSDGHENQVQDESKE